MASIQCSKCNTGIHYHGESNGIQYYFIKKNDWKKICTSYFDKYNKIFSEGNLPKLFRSDTIEEDFSNNIIKAWKCPNCGLMMFFGKNGEIKKEFEPDINNNNNIFPNKPDSYKEYVVFDDYTWDKLTESAIPDNEIAKHYKPTHIAKITTDTMSFYNQAEQCTEKYIAFDTTKQN